jgi:hypothetical protein
VSGEAVRYDPTSLTAYPTPYPTSCLTNLLLAPDKLTDKFSRVKIEAFIRRKMDKLTTSDLVNQRLEAHDIKGAIELVIADAEPGKSIAQDAIASFDQRSNRLTKQADAALSKYKLL